MLSKIAIDVVNYKDQRYPTLGDWFFEYSKDLEQILHIRVSDTGSWHSNVLIVIHELVEALLCDRENITRSMVDEFDKSHLDSGDPGDEKDAPYRDQHCFAIAVERMMAAAMNYPWIEHENLLAQVEKDG